MASSMYASTSTTMSPSPSKDDLDRVGGLRRASSIKRAIMERERADSLAKAGGPSSSRPASPLKQGRFDAFSRSESASTTSQPPSSLKRASLSALKDQNDQETTTSPTLPVFEKLRLTASASSPVLKNALSTAPNTPGKEISRSSSTNDIFTPKRKSTEPGFSTPRRSTLTFLSTEDREARLPHSHSRSLDSSSAAFISTTPASSLSTRDSPAIPDSNISNASLVPGRRIAHRLERIVSGEVSHGAEKENKDPSPSSTPVPKMERPVSTSKIIGGGLSRAGSVRAMVREREMADSRASSGSATSRPASPLKQELFDTLSRANSISTASRPLSARKRLSVTFPSKDPEPNAKESNPTLPGFDSPRSATFQTSPIFANPTAPTIPTTPGKEASPVSTVSETFSSPTRRAVQANPVTPRKTFSFSSAPDREVRIPPSPASEAFPPSTPRLRRQASRDTFAFSAGLSLLPALPAQDDLAPEEDADGEVEVHGIPGRIRLSRNLPSLPGPSSPVHPETVAVLKFPTLAAIATTPSTPKLSKWALWADRNRVDIHAYEYLCRVGEAKGWIEAAMGAEEGMDIPEWEEKMRDGVVLAKLVKGWGAEGKVFEHPKLQWRHSENFNIFLRYARSVGLPENFIFEFTDVYEKKNMPKVIYCIHGLSHLLARRGIAEDIGSLVGELEFSNDQLAAAQKGLNGVAMPNFGDVGKELWKEMKEEEVGEAAEEGITCELPEKEDNMQTFAGGFMARPRCSEDLSPSGSSIPSPQALGRSSLARRRISKHRRTAKAAEGRFVTAVQSQARGALSRSRFVRRKRERASGRPSPSTLKLMTCTLRVFSVLERVRCDCHWANRLMGGAMSVALGLCVLGLVGVRGTARKGGASGGCFPLGLGAPVAWALASRG